MRVQRVVVAHRAGECGVIFESGEVVLWALRAEGEGEGEGEGGGQKVNTGMDLSTGGETLLDLRSVEGDGGAWGPKMLFNPKEGGCMVGALCDVGGLPLCLHVKGYWLKTRVGVKGF